MNIENPTTESIEIAVSNISRAIGGFTNLKQKEKVKKEITKIMKDSYIKGSNDCYAIMQGLK